MVVIWPTAYVLSSLLEKSNWATNHKLIILECGGHLARGGFGSGGSGFGQIRCPFVENKLTDYPSANRLLIGSGGRVG